jgi:hypothetical protein
MNILMKTPTLAIVLMLTVLPVSAEDGYHVQMLYTVDDTYVYRGDNGQETLRGVEDPGNLKTGRHDSEAYTYKTFLKFDLSTVSPDAAFIRSARLVLTGKSNRGSLEHSISIYTVPNDNAWSEDNLAYANRSITGSAALIPGATLLQTVGIADMDFAFDITGKIREYRAAGKNMLSLMIAEDTRVHTGESFTSGTRCILGFYSKESGDGATRPRLQVEEDDVSDLLLDAISIDGRALSAFDARCFHYAVDVQDEWLAVPEIAYEAADAAAGVQFTPALNLTGTEAERTAAIRVSGSGGRSLTYTLTFEPFVASSDVSLAGILIDDRPLEFFSVAKTVYTHYLPYTYDRHSPEITVTKANRKQAVSCTPAADVLSESESGRTAIISVTSSDASAAADYTIVFEKLPKLDLYLAIGQSNMAGRGTPVDAALGDLDTIANSYLFTPALGFEGAANPMNRYSSVRRDLAMQKISPAYGFARHLSEEVPAARAGMVVNARGATSIEEWMKGQEMYEKTVERMKAAQAWGELRGILWHQGEGNSAAPKSWMTKLTQLVADLRTELGTPGALFLAGELNHTKPQQYGELNDSIRTIQSRIPHSGWVSAEGCPTEADGTHFNREGAITLGKRYAEKVIAEIYAAGTLIDKVKAAGRPEYVIRIEDGNVTVDGIEHAALLTVHDICGRKLLSRSIANGHAFNLPMKGIWLLSIAERQSIFHTRICIR